MAAFYKFEFSSRLSATPAQVWAHATSMRGINRELFPLARMTYPREFASLDSQRMPYGRRVFRSWILAACIAPIDYDDLTFVEIEPGRRFLERSSMLTQREWQHERIIEATESGSIITDRVQFVPRIALLGPLFFLIFHLAFRWRHRNLRRLFAAGDASGHRAAAL